MKQKVRRPRKRNSSASRFSRENARKRAKAGVNKSASARKNRFESSAQAMQKVRRPRKRSSSASRFNRENARKRAKARVNKSVCARRDRFERNVQAKRKGLEQARGKVRAKLEAEAVSSSWRLLPNR